MSADCRDAVLPIDEGRYGSPEMRHVFARSRRYAAFVEVEAALARAQAAHAAIPAEAATEITRRARERIDLARVDELERETRHELVAVVRAFAETCGAHGRFVHFGATSSDVLDTALVLQVREALEILGGRLGALRAELAQRARAARDTLMVGRTHGQHALPITLGFKIANWIDELGRHAERLAQLEPRLLVGKMSGAVGSMAGLGERASEIQERTMRELGLRRGAISTQIVHRDRLAELVCWAALLAGTLEMIATEVRNLQRPEIGELCEPFDDAGQVGSSTMPHKRNPVLAENVCGLARIVRSLVVPALETQVTWHERDLVNSSTERFTVPQCCILLDEMLRKMLAIARGLRVFPERMAENLRLSRDRIQAEAVMLELVRRGVPRERAYAVLRELAGAASPRAPGFRDALERHPLVREHLDAAELDAILAAERYLGQCGRLVDGVLADLAGGPAARGSGS